MIQIKNLNYSIGSKHILKDVSLSFEKGKIYSIVGPNGAGKSTLLRHMMGIIKPPQHTVFYEGRDITTFKTKEYAKKASYVFQENPRNMDFTVEEILKMGRYMYTDFLGREDHSSQVLQEVLNLLQLEDFRYRSIRTLSGGEAQKVFVGRALMQKAPVLLLDEPTSMLDVHNSVELLECVKKLQKVTGLTVIMVLHDLNLAFHYSEEMVVMNEGEVILSNEKKQVIDNALFKKVYQNKLHFIKQEDQTFIVPLMQKEL
jgi:iron complex transport system ATP-binding protein